MILIQDASVQFRAEEASWMEPIYGPKLLLCLTLRTNSDGCSSFLQGFWANSIMLLVSCSSTVWAQHEPVFMMVKWCTYNEWCSKAQKYLFPVS